MQTASVIMTTKVVTVTPETSVAEIASLLLEHKISAVPVIDDEQGVVGIVSEGDLLGRPPSGSPRGWWLRLFDESAACLEEIATARHLKARDVMTSPAVTVGEADADRHPGDADAPPRSQTSADCARRQAGWHRQPRRCARRPGAVRSGGRQPLL